MSYLRKNLKRSQQLYNQGVISASELDQERIKLLQAGQSVENVNMSISTATGRDFRNTKTRSGVSINAQKIKLTSLLRRYNCLNS